MTHYTDLKGPSKELWNILDDLLSYVDYSVITPTMSTSVTLAKARAIIKKYAGVPKRI